MRKITIHSDGTPGGTVVLDEDGNKLESITELDIHMQSDQMVETTMRVMMTPTIIESHVERVEASCPVCGETVEHKCDPSSFNADPGSWSSTVTQNLLINPISPLPQGGVTPAAPAVSSVTTSNTGAVLWNPGTHEICGLTQGDQTCRVKKTIDHYIHVDVEKGGIWSFTTYSHTPGTVHHL